MPRIDRKVFTATVASSGSLSGAVKLGELTAVALVSPETLDASTERILFLVSHDDTNYQILRDNDGTAVAVTVAATNTNLHTHLDPSKFAGWTSLKIGTYQSDASTAQTQSSARSFSIVAARVTGP